MNTPPPPPPAIHVQAVQRTPVSTAPFATSQVIQHFQAFRSGYGMYFPENRGRFWHVKHWKGAKHRKPCSRGQGRKAKGKKARRKHA